MRTSWAIVSLLLLACGASEVRFEESVAVEPGGRMVVELAYGEVEVRTHAASEVRVVAVALGEDAGRVEFSLEHDGPDVEFTSEIGLGLPLFPSTSDAEPRRTQSANSESGVGSGLISTSRAPLCLAVQGKEAAG